MPTTVTAKDGDCLCGIAIDFGFIDCAPLRAHPENAYLQNRELRKDDTVTIPDLNVEDHPRAIDTKHTFKLKTSPPINIRFVHGSPHLAYRDDPVVPVLNISNFVTSQGGSSGTAPFPTAYGFNYDGDADLDSFKVEVWDPLAASPIKVTLKALKPVYFAESPGRNVPSHWVDFNDPARRIDDLECAVVGDGLNNTYRSKYLRLVVDEVDHAAAGFTKQFLFVSDMADGLGSGSPGDNDTVEILDQLVQATYLVSRCPAAFQCRVSTIAPIGGDERQRVRLHFYIVRNDVFSDEFLPGIPIATVKQHLRKRTFKWYRRILAQANVAPRLTGITLLDPPQANLLCISHKGGDVSFSGATISFDLESESSLAVPVVVPLVDAETPVGVGQRIAAALPPGFSGEAFTTPLSEWRVNPACDLLITAANGDRVTITNVTITGAAGVTFDLPEPIITNVDYDHSDASYQLLTPAFKRYLRMMPVTDDEVHCLLIGGFSNKEILGRAFSPKLYLDAAYIPPLPYRSATLMAYADTTGGVLDGSDDYPTVSPHETTHVLADCGHTVDGTPHADTQLMMAGVLPGNAVDSAKRLNDGPYLVEVTRTETPKLAQRIHTFKLASELRTNGANKLENW